jgi:hypothetical protein
VDTEKWKSILVHRSMYLEIVDIAKREGRTISGQLRVIFDEWKDAYDVADDREQTKRSNG